MLSYALFPQVAQKFFDVRDGRVAAPEAPKAGGVKTIYVQDLS